MTNNVRGQLTESSSEKKVSDNWLSSPVPPYPEFSLYHSMSTITKMASLLLHWHDFFIFSSDLIM